MPKKPYSPAYDSQQVSRTDLAPQFDAFAQQRQQCTAKGGTWDNKSNTCRMPPGAQNLVVSEESKIKDTTTDTTKPKLTNPEVYTDQKGRPSGIELPDGRTFLGLSQEQTNEIAQREQAKTQLPEGTQRVGTAANEAQRVQQNQRLLQLAQQGLLTPQEIQAIQGASVDVGQALGAGAVGVLPGVIGGASTGLLAGALTGAATGAAAGGFATPVAGGLAIAGAVTGFIAAARSNIRTQQTGEFSADQEALTKGQKYLRSLITDTNQNPQNAPENIAMFYKTLNLIDTAHAKTWKDSQENLNRFTGNDGTEQLSNFEVFDQTMRQYYITQFEMALSAPNPTKNLITAEDLNSFEELK